MGIRLPPWITPPSDREKATPSIRAGRVRGALLRGGLPKIGFVHPVLQRLIGRAEAAISRGSGTLIRGRDRTVQGTVPIRTDRQIREIQEENNLAPGSAEGHNGLGP